MDLDFLKHAAEIRDLPPAERVYRETVIGNVPWKYPPRKPIGRPRPRISDPAGLLRSLDSRRAGAGPSSRWNLPRTQRYTSREW